MTNGKKWLNCAWNPFVFIAIFSLFFWKISDSGTRHLQLITLNSSLRKRKMTIYSSRKKKLWTNHKKKKTQFRQIVRWRIVCESRNATTAFQIWSIFGLIRWPNYSPKQNISNNSCSNAILHRLLFSKSTVPFCYVILDSNVSLLCIGAIGHCFSIHTAICVCATTLWHLFEET